MQHQQVLHLVHGPSAFHKAHYSPITHLFSFCKVCQSLFPRPLFLDPHYSEFKKNVEGFLLQSKPSDSREQQNTPKSLQDRICLPCSLLLCFFYNLKKKNLFGGRKWMRTLSSSFMGYLLGASRSPASQGLGLNVNLGLRVFQLI